MEENASPYKSRLSQIILKYSEILRIIFAIVSCVIGIVLILATIGVVQGMNYDYEILFQTKNLTIANTFGRPDYVYTGYLVGIVFTLFAIYSMYFGIKAVGNSRLFKKALILCVMMFIFIYIFFAGFSFGPNKTSKPVITDTSYVSPTPYYDQTAGWKNYENETEFFSFKYPQEWNVADGSNDNLTSIGPKAPNDTAVYLTVSTDKNNFIDYRSQKLCSQLIVPTEAPISQWGNCLQDSQQAITTTSLGSKNATSFYMREGGNTYHVVQLDNPSVQLKMYNDGNNDSIFNQILPTFKFIDSSTWQTYSNKQDNYSVKYPSDWITRTIGTECSIKGQYFYSQAEFSNLTEQQTKCPPFDDVLIKVETNSENLSAQDFINKDSSPSGQLSAITVDGVNGVKVINPQREYSGQSVYLPKDGQMYIISWIEGQEPSFDLIFNQMLSSFKFTK